MPLNLAGVTSSSQEDKQYEVIEVLLKDEDVSLCAATSPDGQGGQERWLLKRRNAADQQSSLMAELALRSRLDSCHPNLHMPMSALVSSGRLVLLYEPCGVVLRELQRKWAGSGFPMADVRRLVLQIVSAVASMHQSGFVHGSLNPKVRPGCQWVDSHAKRPHAEGPHAMRKDPMRTHILAVPRGQREFLPLSHLVFYHKHAGHDDARGRFAEAWAVGLGHGGNQQRLKSICHLSRAHCHQCLILRRPRDHPT